MTTDPTPESLAKAREAIVAVLGLYPTGGQVPIDDVERIVTKALALDAQDPGSGEKRA